MQLEFFPSRTLVLYLSRLFVSRIFAVLVMLVLVLMILDLLGESGDILSQPGNGEAQLLQYVSLRVPQLIARFLPYSVLLATMKQTYTDLFGAEPKVAAIHAGLETSVAGVKYPGLDMISVGPTILDVHSPDERMEVATVQKVYDLLVATLAQLQ